jgi:phospholipid/cholesterol/gamma-HCH transport system permease protein
MFPVVVVLAMAVGVASGWLTAVNLLDLSTVEFVRGLKLFYRFKDVWFGLVKSASFGLTISLVGCIAGLSADRGAEAVGRATTRAVVVSAMLILVLDAFWAIVLL